MSSQPVIRKLYDLPLGSRFRYRNQAVPKTYVLLGYGDSGLIADAPTDGNRRIHGMYSAAESRAEFCEMLVVLVPVEEVSRESPAMPAPPLGHYVTERERRIEAELRATVLAAALESCITDSPYASGVGAVNRVGHINGIACAALRSIGVDTGKPRSER